MLKRLYTETTWGRWLAAVGGILINLALGVLYSWSVFRGPLSAEFGWKGIQTSLPFAVATLVFALFMIPAGRLQDRIGPRKVGMLGGVILALGYLLPGLTRTLGLKGGAALAWIILTYGVVGGIGLGVAYAVPIATAVKWFPDKRGLVSGLAVFGFGFASLVFGPLAATMIGFKPATATSPAVPGNWPQTLVTLGLIFFVMIEVGAYLLEVPPPGWAPKGWTPPAPAPGIKKAKVDYGPSEIVRLPQFYALLVMYALAAMAGLMVINFAAVYATDVKFNETAIKAGLGFFNAIPVIGFNIWTGTKAAMAAVATGWLAMWNGLGRIIIGWVSDRIGRTQAMLLNFLLIAASMILLMVAGANPWVLMLGYMVVGLTYGANLALFPATNADWFGTKHVGVNYGLVFIGWGIAGVTGALVGGAAKDYLGGYGNAYLVAAVLALVAAVLAFVTKAPAPKEEVEAAPA